MTASERRQGVGTLGQIQAAAATVAMPTGRARFLPLAAAGAALGCSPAQAYSLICHGDLPAIRLAGCGQWRVERALLEQYLRLACERPTQLVDDSV